jgi:hypothetical protein
MSTLYHTAITCPACGVSQQVEIADSLNANRMPQCRDWVLERALFRATCACGEALVVLHPLLYVDFDRGLWIQVAMEPDRPNFAALEALALDAFRQAFDPTSFPALSAFSAMVRPRVVFGYEELREKVVAADAGLDDALVEALKLEILVARPDLLHDGVEQIVLVDASDNLRFELFAPGADGDPEPYGVLDVARSGYESIAARRDHVRRMMPRLFDGTYVHVARYRFQADDDPSLAADVTAN